MADRGHWADDRRGLQHRDEYAYQGGHRHQHQDVHERQYRHHDEHEHEYLHHDEHEREYGRHDDKRIRDTPSPPPRYQVQNGQPNQERRGDGRSVRAGESERQEEQEHERHDDGRRYYAYTGERPDVYHHQQGYDRAADVYDRRAEFDRRVGPPPLRRQEVHPPYDPHYPGYDHPEPQPRSQPQPNPRPLGHAQLAHESALHALIATSTAEPFAQRTDARLDLDNAVPARGGRILDIGADVFGLDVDQVWKLPAPRNCEFHVADLDTLTVPRATRAGAETLEVPEDTFDVVHLRFMHAKVHDFPALLQHAWSLLRPGGLLLLLDSAFLPAYPTPHAAESHAVPPGVESYVSVLSRAMQCAGVAPFSPDVGALLDSLGAVSTGFEVDYDLPLGPAHRAALGAGLVAARYYLEHGLGLTLHQVRRLEDGYAADLGEGMIVRYTALGSMLHRERQYEMMRAAERAAPRSRRSIAALLN
ncbi:uncharacterized protein LOC62_02G001939 [Vanrija pseudolonga]|uniref:Methyltransferase type 11 domain-containing protein n=1 Tax=Vanrija pseudolonga TaxID=143232 RepID=A0AAF0Y654_9TREE|nr:hypothetical protein LOC62_02G001939 [Vanrija pseudolonga]